MAPVLVHGDVNAGQVLVDEGSRVTGVLDWETAHLGHPLKDFDLGEWGYGIFAWDAKASIKLEIPRTIIRPPIIRPHATVRGWRSGSPRTRHHRVTSRGCGPPDVAE